MTAAQNLALDPARTALLVMDYQPGIIGRLADPDAQLDRAVASLEVARRHGAHVGYVRVAFTDDDFASVPPHSSFATIASDRSGAFHADAPGTQIDPRVAPTDADIVVRKRRIGALSTTDLHEQLQARGVDTLVLAGLSTSGVVLSTVRDAADRDYRLVVLSDATADPDEEVHRFLIERILPRQATIATTQEFDRALAAG